MFLSSAISSLTGTAQAACLGQTNLRTLIGVSGFSADALLNSNMKFGARLTLYPIKGQVHASSSGIPTVLEPLAVLVHMCPSPGGDHHILLLWYRLNPICD